LHSQLLQSALDKKKTLFTAVLIKGLYRTSAVFQNVEFLKLSSEILGPVHCEITLSPGQLIEWDGMDVTDLL